MIGMILSWLTGGGIKALAAAYTTHKNSAVESERIGAEIAKARLDAAVRAQGLANEVRLATAGYLEVRFVTFAISAGFAFHALAVVVDTMPLPGKPIGAWGIPPLPGAWHEWESTIILAPFGVQVAQMGFRSIAASMIGRRP